MAIFNITIRKTANIKIHKTHVQCSIVKQFQYLKYVFLQLHIKWYDVEVSKLLVQNL